MEKDSSAKLSYEVFLIFIVKLFYYIYAQVGNDRARLVDEPTLDLKNVQ